MLAACVENLEAESHYSISKKHRRIVDNRGSAKRLKKSQSNLEVAKKVNPAERFVLMVAVNSFLSNDYEYCQRISQYNFEKIASSYVYESNILRIKSLCSELLFQ